MLVIDVGKPVNFQVTQIQDDISQFSSNVQRIQELHGRTLNAADEGTRQRDGAVLDDLVAQTRQISNSLKEKIQSLASYPVSRPQDQAVRRDQVRALFLGPHAHVGASADAEGAFLYQANRLRTRFVEVLQTYQNVERDYRQRYKQRIERQFRIGERCFFTVVGREILTRLPPQSSPMPRRRRYRQSSRTLKVALRFSHKRYVTW